MNRLLTALTSDTEDMAETYRIRRLMAVAIGAVLLGMLILLFPWGWVPTPNIPNPPKQECKYDFDAQGQLWYTSACNPDDLP